MDIYSLAIAHIHTAARPARMNARAEDRYYSNHRDVRRSRPGLLGSIAMVGGVIMMLGISLI